MGDLWSSGEPMRERERGREREGERGETRTMYIYDSINITPSLEQVRSDNNASEVDILGHFRTF